MFLKIGAGTCYNKFLKWESELLQQVPENGSRTLLQYVPGQGISYIRDLNKLLLTLKKKLIYDLDFDCFEV